MRAALLLVLFAILATPAVQSQTWTSLGPDGGDARTLAVDPSNSKIVYLGTTDGHIFGSRDGGRRWQLLGLAGSSTNSTVTAIIVDPRDSNVLLASTWTRERSGEGGGIYRSSDAGRTWRASGLAGHAVRALVAAPSDPDALVAGALDGVFRSRDGGQNWEMITPANDPELRNFDSLAVDPRDPEIIYAGTFHLPWKTTDGGRDWAAIHEGMIDDSDVLSLAVNPSNPEQIFASACSGIYRSDDAGARWKRIQGIPDSSRRTLVIRFDPGNPKTLYAGTTEGLWKSAEGGARWRRVSPADWVINSLAVIRAGDGDSRTMIGTEQQGVLVSSGANDKFEPANDGFAHRRVVALTLDRENSGRLGAVLANGLEPVVVTDDGGTTWFPLGSGLEAGGLRRLFSTPHGWWIAIASGGLMRLDQATGKWLRAGILADPTPLVRAMSVASHRPKVSATPFRAIVNDMAFSADRWFAATDNGLFSSSDAGVSWTPLPFSSLALPVNSVRASADGEKIRLVSSHGMIFSGDGGNSWQWHDLPFESYGALRLEIVDDSTLLATSPRGLYVSRDAGETWRKTQAGLPASPIGDVLVRPGYWAVSMEKGGIYLSRDRGANWSRVGNPSGAAEGDSFPVLEAGYATDRIYAGSSNESLYLLDLSQPPVVANGLSSGH
ncbi:MAG: WD40/YVTN/BNR-like repeat-containing protein [Candidatus Acidiferrales bacterium]